ncbi:MAG TPA: nucleotidyltransferase domain-containing protein [Candidatus Lokiarchaeia archaeon]|nr:nucleotidyltransferase domain-containing protein [Candidatus Lokiarchaeia archaeon]
MSPASTRPMPVEELVENLLQVFLPHEEVQLAYLYGSYVWGPWTSRSDIDIGVYVTPEADQDPWFPIHLQDELTSALPLQCEFDVRVLNRTGSKFNYKVIFRTPKILIRDELLRVEFETRTLLEWYDMRPTYEMYRRELGEVLKG